MIIKHGQHIFLRSSRGAQRNVAFFFSWLHFLDADWLGSKLQSQGVLQWSPPCRLSDVMSVFFFFYCPEMHTAIVHVFLTCTVAYLGVGLEAVSLVVGFFPTKATSLSASILLCNNKNKYSGLWILKTFRKLIFPLSTDWLIGLQTPSVSITCSILNNIQASALGCHKRI